MKNKNKSFMVKFFSSLGIAGLLGLSIIAPASVSAYETSNIQAQSIDSFYSYVDAIDIDLIPAVENGTLTLSGTSLNTLEGAFTGIGQSSLNIIVEIFSAAQDLVVLVIAIGVLMMFVKRRV